MANELALILKSPVEELIPKMIAWNNAELLARVEATLEQYKGVTYDDSQIATAKADRAQLNAFCKALNDERIRIGKVYNAPYEKFKGEVDEVLQKVKGTVAERGNRRAGQGVRGTQAAGKAERDHRILQGDRRRLFGAHSLRAHTQPEVAERLHDDEVCQGGHRRRIRERPQRSRGNRGVAVGGRGARQSVLLPHPRPLRRAHGGREAQSRARPRCGDESKAGTGGGRGGGKSRAGNAAGAGRSCRTCAQNAGRAVSGGGHRRATQSVAAVSQREQNQIFGNLRRSYHG